MSGSWFMYFLEHYDCYGLQSLRDAILGACARWPDESAEISAAAVSVAKLDCAEKKIARLQSYIAALEEQS